MATTHQNQNDRELVCIQLPAGSLAVNIRSPDASFESNNHVWVLNVKANSPLAGSSSSGSGTSKLVPGDWIVSINECNVHGQGVGFCKGILAATAQSTTRTMVVLRSRIPQSFIEQKENTVNARTATNQAMPLVTPHQKPPPPSLPLSQGSAPHAPLITMVTTTATTPMKKLPPLQPSAISKKASPVQLSISGLRVCDKPKVQKKKQDPPKPKPKPQRKQAPLSRVGSSPNEHDTTPEPGFVCSKQKFYCTHNNETVSIVAAKLGTDWKSLANMPENKQRYGTLKANTSFKADTMLAIPASYSKWKMQKLKAAVEVDEDKEECMDCGIASNPAELLLCDGCDSLHHVHCVGLSAVPKGDWFCRDCIAILQARAAHTATANAATRSTLTSSILPELGPTRWPIELTVLGQNLQELLSHRRRLDLQGVMDIYATAQESWQGRKMQLEITMTQLEACIVTAKRNHDAVKQQAKDQYGVLGYHLPLSYYGRNGWIELRNSGRLLQNDETTHERVAAYSHRTNLVESARWKRARQRVSAVHEMSRVQKLAKSNLETELRTTQEKFNQEELEAKSFAETEQRDLRAMELRHAALLGADKLDHETVTAFTQREPVPRYLGRIYAENDGDVMALNMLREPNELILTIPMDCADADIDIDSMEPKLDKWYGIFARQALFQKQRDDELPLVAGVRSAQRRLFQLLIEHNKDMLVSSPSLPPTVKVRTVPDTRCFDLSELVRDCDVDLDLPREPTPAVLAAKGLQLRDYQESSLRWMLDKETENVGLGLAGELWHRLRFLDAGSGEFFYCDLTGSWSLDIFDYRDDVDQKDASVNRFSMPTGGLLGEEMGLGKTVIAIALIVANPPPLHLRVLPREHIWSLEKKITVDHPAYVPPPSGALSAETAKLSSTETAKFSRLLNSNGTLIIVPMTLLSQWQSEIERYAGHLSVTTLHNEESTTAQAIATSDVVIVSTFLIQQSNTKSSSAKSSGTKSSGTKSRGKVLLQLLKRVHWHRIVVDEAHMNNQTQTKLAVSALSATHRHAVTGTPIGAQLSDLYDQVRFLRLAPFCRPSFWKNLIEDPYYERDGEALRVLRSLLSRIVMRHSKRQTFDNGTSLLALPPRTVETILLQFGSESEKQVYQSIEARNRKHFLELKRVSMATVAARFIELSGMLASARQACAHSSLISLEKLHHFHFMAEEKVREKARREKEEARKKYGKTSKKDFIASSQNQTREGLLRFALSQARESARLRMRVAMNKHQNGDQELLECPVCFEVVGEQDIAVPACAHLLCSACTLAILDEASSTREVTGHCPCCRDVMKRSEITFLGDATDAGTASGGAKEMEEDSKPAAIVSSSSNSNGFQTTVKDLHARVSAAEASTIRASRSVMSGKDLHSALHEDRARLHTLDEKLLTSYYDCETKVGTKVARLLHEINAMTTKSAKSKCVVFSQFAGVLDVAAEELTIRGIGFVRIDGKMKQHERADALLEFSSNPNAKVFLLSMRSGAVGLTLTAADHCFIMDIAQNSAIEEQAIDRIHRIGQVNPVTVKRLVIEGTVEERLLGVRRSLAADDGSTGTICGASALDDDETKRPAKRARTTETQDDGIRLDDGNRQRRVEMLEELFGCTVHKA